MQAFDDNPTPAPTDAEVATCLKVLRTLVNEPAATHGQHTVEVFAARLHQAARKRRRGDSREDARARDRELVEATALGRADSGSRGTVAPALPPEPAAEGARQFNRPRDCYACKRPYRRAHFFYHALCPTCAEVNYAKRYRRTDLTGRRALVTGGRVKIGYETASKFLRDGADVIVTTRFPADAARRFAAESDFAAWRVRLRVYGLDLRNLPAVEAFAGHLLDAEPALDIMVNNAAQTVHRPPAFYAHLLEAKSAPQRMLPDDVRAVLRVSPEPRAPPLLSAPESPPGHPLFPAGQFDEFGQQRDLRPTNSWVLKLDEVPTAELLEVQLVNVVAPFLLTARLKPLMLCSRQPSRYVVNVSAVEGQFGRPHKTVYHPHTNMAKAALNMLTRTSAADYARDRVYMNSVDTGWVSMEDPHATKQRAHAAGFRPPLDAVDAAARIYDPILRGIAGEPVHGQYLKDYEPAPW
jgi:NAD(P)-dependent dehydrogenase (short-subunit alcohol dehydrogenase family)